MLKRELFKLSQRIQCSSPTCSIGCEDSHFVWCVDSLQVAQDLGEIECPFSLSGWEYSMDGRWAGSRFLAGDDQHRKCQVDWSHCGVASLPMVPLCPAAASRVHLPAVCCNNGQRSKCSR